MKALALSLRMGAEVTLVSGPSRLIPPSGVRFVPVESTQQMHDAVMEAFTEADCLVMAAAPADYTPEHVHDKKIKKSGQKMQLELQPTVDILKAVADRRRKRQVVVGFALETNDGPVNARKKLRDKKLDVIILNIPVAGESGFEADTNRVTIIPRMGKAEEIPLAPKTELAFTILERVIVPLIESKD